MTVRAADEHGFTLIELLVAMVVTVIVLGAVSNVFVSGTRAGADATARVDAQESTRDALDQIEFESRCASSATLISSGAGVALALPSQCSNGSGDVSWCVTGGVLTRYAASGCDVSGGVPVVRNIVSPTPFSLLTASGDLPRLDVRLTVDEAGSAADAATLDDTITLRNASRGASS